MAVASGAEGQTADDEAMDQEVSGITGYTVSNETDN
jgi:hypothetical protein